MSSWVRFAAMTPATMAVSNTALCWAVTLARSARAR